MTATGDTVDFFRVLALVRRVQFPALLATLLATLLLALSRAGGVYTLGAGFLKRIAGQRMGWAPPFLL